MTLRELRAKFPSYVVIHFTRVFTTGLLEGIRCPDKIMHVDRWHAAQWLRGIRANSKRGAIEYHLIDVSVVPRKARTA